MQEIYQDIPRLYTALVEWLACFMYLLILKRRYSNQITAGISFVALIVQIFFLILTGNLDTIFWLPCMILAVGIMYCYLLLTCKVTPLGAGYCCARAFLLAEFAASLEWQIQTYLFLVGLDSWWIEGAVLLLIYSFVFGIAYFLEKPMFSKEYLFQLSMKEFISAIGIVILIFAFSNLSFVFTNSPFTGRLKSDIFIIRTVVDLGGIAILYAFQSRISEYIAEKENISIQSMLKSQYDQYRNFQEGMEMVHIKYHDLKHQIAGLRAETDVKKRKEWLDAMERELDLYQGVEPTGNHVLDTILAAKIMQCIRNKI